MTFWGEGSCLDFLGSYLACCLSMMLQQPFLLKYTGAILYLDMRAGEKLIFENAL
jgi:hypothetical protein